MTSRTAAADVEAFLAHLEELSQHGRLSKATLRQRRWALRELLSYASSVHGMPAERVPLEDLLDPDLHAGWLGAAVNGELRQRASSTGTAKASLPALRARAASLRALGAWLGRPVTLPVERRPSPRERQHGTALSRLRALFDGRRPVGVTQAVWVRTRALVHLIVDTDARTGELIALTREDLDLENGRVRIARRPPGPGSTRQPPCWVPVSAATTRALRRWLTARAELVAGLQGGEPRQLWVTAHPSESSGRILPVGLPISANGLDKRWAWVRGLLIDSLGPCPYGVPLPEHLNDWRPAAGDGSDSEGRSGRG